MMPIVSAVRMEAFAVLAAARGSSVGSTSWSLGWLGLHDASGWVSRPRLVTEGGRPPGLWVGWSVLHVDEAAVVALEDHGDRLGLAVTVLGDDQVGFAGAFGGLVVHVLAVEKDHHVGVLLQ